MSKIIIDIDVYDCQIRAAKPHLQTSMPLDDAGKMLFSQSAPLERFNNHVWGELKGKGLRKAQKVVDEHGGINISGWYGSIEIDEKDFIPFEAKKN